MYTHRHTYTWTHYTTDYYSAINKNEILPFATILVELKSIIVSEIS